MSRDDEVDLVAAGVEGWSERWGMNLTPAVCREVAASILFWAATPAEAATAYDQTKAYARSLLAGNVPLLVPWRPPAAVSGLTVVEPHEQMHRCEAAMAAWADVYGLDLNPEDYDELIASVVVNARRGGTPVQARQGGIDAADRHLAAIREMHARWSSRSDS